MRKVDKEREMAQHQEMAANLFIQGYNCAQAVFVAFCDKTGMEPRTALKLSSSFGGGMGRLREVCGAVSGMFMIAGLLYGCDDTNDKTQKDTHYALIRRLSESFKGQACSIICRDLLALQKTEDSQISEEHTEEYYAGRSCVELVKLAANIVDTLIAEME